MRGLFPSHQLWTDRWDVASDERIFPVDLAGAMTNPRADRVARVRSLSQKSVRARTSTFVVEGPQAVREAVRFGAARINDVYVTRQAASRWPEIVDDALAADLWVHPVSDEVMERMSPDAQGVLAVMEAVEPDLADVVAAGPSLVAICEELRDPGNAGTVIRAADAAGADAVIFTLGSVEVTSPKVVRSSAGSLFHLPVVTGVGLADAVTALRAAGCVVLAADGGGEHSVETSPLIARPTAWIFGTEAQGLSDDARAMADAMVSVPLRGSAESLNVAMAATVCLYSSSRAHAAPSSR